MTLDTISSYLCLCPWPRLTLAGATHPPFGKGQPRPRSGGQKAYPPRALAMHWTYRCQCTEGEEHLGALFCNQATSTQWTLRGGVCA